MKQNDPVVFLKAKDFKFIEEIGQGGTGRTILMRDETIDEIFVCKKYSPYNEDDKEIYYNYFKDEIKILYKTNHPNIVRVFNYYLYPEETTGYIIMEHINGENIDDYLNKNPDQLDDIFRQTIEGFKHLEEKEILHRDIRPNNILVAENGIAKIIDFGFGKHVHSDSVGKSITLNWRYTTPKEFEQEIYNHKTDIYFIGKLFEEIIISIGNVNFKYSDILSKMINPNEQKRINSFFDIHRGMLNEQSPKVNFTLSEKRIYQNFADEFTKIFVDIEASTLYENNINQIIRDLDEINRNSMLENVLQSNVKLARVFIRGEYHYYHRQDIKTEIITAFLDFLKSSSEDKRKIILNNLWIRLDSIKRYVNDDLPF